MTHRERLLAACQGRPADRLIWAPRLDLWHKAHSYRGTLPRCLAGDTLRQITDHLGLPYHAVVPDFQDLRSTEDEADRGLGVWRLKEVLHETILRGVERVVVQQGEVTRVTYQTPVGSLSCAFEYTAAMQQAGVTIPWVIEHVLKGEEDIAPLAFVFANAEVRPNYDRYAQWQRWVGEAGVAVGFANGAASPLHHVLHDLASVESFFLLLHDHPSRMMQLAEAIGEWSSKVLGVAASSPAEIVFWGGNYDAAITYPRFFEQHVRPWLQRAADELHASGKLLLTHTDGENSGLTRYYREAGVDVADSVCPSPMTRLSLEEAIEQLRGVTIWGGIPSVALLPEAVCDDEFEHMLEKTLALVSGRAHFILGVADCVPPEASWDRVLRITELAAK